MAKALSKEDFGGFWIRAAALTVDSMILLIPNFAVQLASGILFQPETAPWVAFLVNLMVAYVYYAPLQAYYCGTPGKRLLGLELLTAKGQRLSLLQATLRYGVSFLSGIVLGLGYFWAAGHRMKQTWHDLAIGSIVVRKGAFGKSAHGHLATVRHLPTRQKRNAASDQRRAA